MMKRLGISILCLVETWVKQINFAKIVSSMLSGWEVINNYSAHYLGRVWICWDPGGSSIKVFDVHEQVITCHVNSADMGIPWMFSVVYGATQGLERRHLLQKLSYIKNLVGCHPWLLAGDFNVVRTVQEKWGNAGISCYGKEFEECIQGLEKDDLAYTGCFHTCTNNQAGPNFVYRKLDRVMSNVVWFEHFGNTSVEFLERGLSDHSQALVTVAKFISYGPKPFKFFNFWTEHAHFLDWTGEGWRVEVDGYAMYKLYSKLKYVKSVLKHKNLQVSGGLGHKVVQARHNLAIAQAEFLSSGGSEECQRREMKCLHHFISIRNKWLNLGDGNNAFFHNSIKVRNSSNLIKC